jgi:hypothetical protein
MAKIPSILARESINVPMLGESGGPAAFLTTPGVGNVARGLGGLSNAVGESAETVSNIERKKTHDSEVRWVGESIRQELDLLNEWQSKPENNTSEQYAAKFKQFSDERIAGVLEQAPSKRAGADFSQRFGMLASNRYGEALHASERIRLENTKNGFVDQISQSLETFRGSEGVPGVDAIGELTVTRADLHGRIEEIFGKVAPTTARALKARVDAEFAIGIAHRDPDLSARMIKMSSHIDETDKATLLNKIEAVSQTHDMLAKDNFRRAREDRLVQVARGLQTEGLPLSEYKAVYGKDAERHKVQDDYQVDIFNSANTFVTRVGGLNSSASRRELNKLANSVTDKKSELTWEVADRRMKAIDELREDDRVTWLLSYNPEIKETDKLLSGVTNPDQRNALLNQRNESILKYQGSPGTDYENKDMYLGLASGDRALMTAEEATKNAGFINSGDPQEVIGKIQQVLAEYPDDAHKYIAFQDLTQLKGSAAIKPEYQLIWQNQRQWWVDTYAEALTDAKSITALTEERAAELDKEVENNKTWAKFEGIMSSGGRNEEAAAFKSGIMSYANYLHTTQKKSMSQAVKQSLNALLDTTIGFTTVHNQPMMISKERLDPKAPNRTDDEILDIGRRLTISLKDIDPREIDQSRFMALDAISEDKNHINRLQELRNIITRDGYFVTEADGQSATLFVVGDRGIPFQVTDPTGAAFQIFFDDMPDYTVDTREET